MKLSMLRVALLVLLIGGIQGFCALPGVDAGSFASSLKNGDLVSLQGTKLHPFDSSQLAHTRFFAIYYSASWCPPCRGFTPKLVKFYDEVKPGNPQFEVILVCRDQTLAGMEKYMTKDEMKWPALTFSKIRSHKILNQYAGNGIPDLVLVDAQGKVLSDSFDGKNYLGPQKVVQDIRTILSQNPPTADEIKAAAQKSAPGSSAKESDFDKLSKKPTPTPTP